MSAVDFNSPAYYARTDEQKQQQTLMLAGGLSAVLAIVAGVWLAMRTRRPPTRIQRAEATLANAAARAEQAARTVRKQAPSFVERGAERVESAARTVRKQGPGMVAQGANRAEQVARTVRKQGPAKLRAGYEQTEQAWSRTRDFGNEVGAQAGQVIERSRKAGETVADTTTQVSTKLRNRFGW